jgi:hypothetical protein
MTDATNTATVSKNPTYVAYHIRKGKGERSYWTRIGSAWANKDGEGFNIQLDGLVPLDGRISVRIISEKPDTTQQYPSTGRAERPARHLIHKENFMPKTSSQFIYTNHSGPKSCKKITLVWSTEDVRQVRPDLDTNQAWQVLQDCERIHELAGVTWDLLKFVAEDMFPKGANGVRP